MRFATYMHIACGEEIFLPAYAEKRKPQPNFLTISSSNFQANDWFSTSYSGFKQKKYRANGLFDLRLLQIFNITSFGT